MTPLASRMPPARPSAARDEPDEDGLEHHRAAAPGRRPAPTARSRASSRVRCGTRIEKVLEITKTPTSRAMHAEDRMSACWKKAKPACTSEDSCGRGLLAGEHLGVVGEHRPAMRVGELLLADALLGAGQHRSGSRPSVPAMPLRLGEGELRPRRRPAELSAVPKSTVPTSLYSLRPSWVTMRDGVADLEAAVVGGGDVERHLVVGLGPAALGDHVRRERRCPSIQLSRSVGGPCDAPIGSPSASRTRLLLPKPEGDHVAARRSATPSTAATVVDEVGVEELRAGRRPPNGSLKSTSPCTWASTFSLPSAKRSSKTLSRVSVSTKVPAMNATPSTIAMIVRRAGACAPRRSGG